MRSNWRQYFFLLLAILVLVSFTFAQETTGGLQGVVKDPTGAVVSKATVEVTSPALIGIKKLETDASGYYRFSNLPPGAYTVTVSAPNFRTQKLANIELLAGHEASADVILQVGMASEVVEVSGQGVMVEPTTSKSQTNITSEIITNIPKGRNYLSMIDFAPGARSEPLQATGTGQSAAAGYQIDGASNSENAYLVEGMDTSSIQTGRAGIQVPFEFVQEVQIKSSGFEAEHGGALGGVVNVIQKRGSNEWHGEVLTHWRNDSLEASPNGVIRQVPGISTKTVAGNRVAAPMEYYTPKEDKYTILEPGFQVGGALLKDRLWVFSSYIPRLQWDKRAVNFNCTKGTCTGVTQNQIGQREFQDFYQTHYGLTRLDFMATDKLRLFGAWQYAYQRGRGTSWPQADPEDLTTHVNPTATNDPRAYRQDTGYVQPNSVYTFGADMPLTSSFVVTARFGYWFNNYADRGTPTGLRYTWNASNINYKDVPAAYQAASGSFNIPATGVTLFDTFKRKTISTDAAYFHRGWSGTHNFKVGWQMNNLTNDVNYQEEPQSLVQLYWGGKTGGQSGTYGYYIVRDFQRKGAVSSNNHSLFAQDSWTVGKGLTLNLGIRFDSERLPSFIKGNPDIEFSFLEKVAPRLGAAWDVMGNGKWKIYGSYGLFYDIMKYELPRGSFGGEYWHNCYYTLNTYVYTDIVPVKDSAGHYCPQSGPITATAMPGTFVSNSDFRFPSNAATDNLIDPDLKPMQQAEYVLGSDYAINDKLGVEVRYARKRLHRTIEDVGNFIVDSAGNTNEVYFITNPGEGLGKAPLHDICPTCPSSPKAIRNYDGLEFRLTKRGSSKWFGTLSYTYSRLYGNYSGLTSTDESGRGSPNVNRFFDLPFMPFTATGKIDDGPLATDRPHTFKAYGYYMLKWFGMETMIGANQMWYTGTPVTTMIPLLSTDTSWQPAIGRGAFQDLTLDSATGLVSGGTIHKGMRTPSFSQTDLVLSHEIKVSKTNEARRIGFEFNATNLFNQHNVLRLANVPTIGTYEVLYPTTATGAEDWMAMMKTGYNYINGINGVGAQFADQGGNILFNPMYGKPNLFQSPRSMRLTLRFKF